MAGEARTQAFSIGTATVMLGPLADMWKLNPEDHSIGLVKDFSVSSEPTYTELRQGVKNALVYSILTQNEVRASCSVYEYTPKNLRYSLGVTPGTFERFNTKLSADVAADAVSITIVATGGDASAAKTFVEGKGVVAGAYIFIHDKGGNRDNIHLAKVKTVTGAANAATLTLEAANAVPSAFKAGAEVGVIDKFEAGVKTEQEFYSMKVVGILPEGSQPIVLLVPKIRIIRGFNVNFSTDDFQSMPWEFSAFEPVTGDGTVGDLPNGGVMSVLVP